MARNPVKVLLVDDGEAGYLVAEHLAAGVQGNEYLLDWISDYDSAVTAIQSCEHDVCLITHPLNRRSGTELIQRVHQAGSHPPLVLLNLDGGNGTEPEGRATGAAEVLHPYQLTPSCLGCVIRAALERHRGDAGVRQLTAFADFNPNPILAFAPNGTLNYSNQAAQRLAATVGCDSVLGLLPPETPAIIRDVMTSHKSWPELQNVLDRRSFTWTFFPILSGCAVFCHGADLTLQFTLEKQLRHTQKMEAVGQLAAGVAHDFNNILTIIEGRAALLAGAHEAHSPCLRPLQEIRDAAERAGNLIRQLLMFSRKQVLQLRPVDLNQELETLLPALRRVVGRNIRVQLSPATGLPCIPADSVMLETALTNLALNAREAMPNGGLLLIAARPVRITDEAAAQNPEARPGEFVQLSVSDTGAGMSPDVLARIFEPFFTTKQVGQGPGLGLATVYGMVKQHQGWIEVQSEPGRGTTFNLFFPATQRAPVAAAASVPKNTTPPPAPRGQETILVAEDEPALRELVVEILQHHGYCVHSAGSGTEARDVWSRHRAEIDILVTDMVMPGMSGSELAEVLQKEDPALKVIYTSGYSPGMAGKDLALLEGFNFLPKPYPPSKLAHLVRECLDAPVGASVQVK